jgi:hypothetical protein
VESDIASVAEVFALQVTHKCGSWRRRICAEIVRFALADLRYPYGNGHAARFAVQTDERRILDCLI